MRTKKQKVIAEDSAYDARTVTIHPKTKKIETVTFLKARKEIQVIDPKVRSDYETLAKLHMGDISVLNRDDSDKIWIVSYINDNAPVSYYVFDRKKQKATYLFSNRTALEKVALGSMQPISFLARDGLTIYGYLTLPNNQQSKNLPLVLNVHGGPQSRDVWGLNPRVQWLANRGYAVLQVNYRGSIGYGKAYMSAGFREWGGKMQDDLTDGVKWAIEQGIADPSKICIFGGSYGGYAALVGATFTPDLYKCAVDIVGPSNLITMIET
ncbi:MAG: prolyl oligopeptidase family serine peptidase, partial [Myxococcaceae bacterium]